MKKNDSTSYLFEIITGIIWIMEMLDINEYMPILTTQIDEMVHIDFLCKNFIVYVFTWCTMFGWWLVSSVIISKSDYCPISLWDQAVFLASFVFELHVHLEVCIDIEWQWIDEEFEEGSEDVMGRGKGEKKTKRKTTE